MADLGSQVYNLTMQNLVTLWIIDFNPVIQFTPASDGIMYISAYKDDSANLVYDGNTYNYAGIQGSGFRSEINGQLPEPQLVIDKASLTKIPQYQNIKNQFTSETGNVFFDWRGATITRIRTTSNYLNDTTKSDVNEFYVDQITRSTKSTIEVKMTVSIGADRLSNQSIQELAYNRCGLRYREWDGSTFDHVSEAAGGCPYGNPTTGSNWSNVPDFGLRFYNENDVSVPDAVNDVCSYSVKGCQLRFDPNEDGLTLPFSGKHKATGNDSTTEPGSL